MVTGLYPWLRINSRSKRTISIPFLPASPPSASTRTHGRLKPPCPDRCGPEFQIPLSMVTEGVAAWKQHGQHPVRRSHPPGCRSHRWLRRPHRFLGKHRVRTCSMGRAPVRHRYDFITAPSASLLKIRLKSISMHSFPNVVNDPGPEIKEFGFRHPQIPSPGWRPRGHKIHGDGDHDGQHMVSMKIQEPPGCWNIPACRPLPQVPAVQPPPGRRSPPRRAVFSTTGVDRRSQAPTRPTRWRR